MPTIVKYFSLNEIIKDASSLPAPWFVMSNTTDSIHIGAMDKDFNLKYHVSISQDLKASVFIHRLQALQVTLESQTLLSLLKQIEGLNECSGVSDPVVQDFAPLPDGPLPTPSSFYRHVIQGSPSGVISHKSIVRAAECRVITKSSEELLCAPCREVNRRLQVRKEREICIQSKPLHPNTPLSSARKSQLATALKESRRHKSGLQNEIEKMHCELEKDAVEVPRWFA